MRLHASSQEQRLDFSLGEVNSLLHSGLGEQTWVSQNCPSESFIRLFLCGKYGAGHWSGGRGEKGTSRADADVSSSGRDGAGGKVV